MNIIDPSGHFGVCPGTITQNDDGYCGYADYIAKVTPIIPTDSTPSDSENNNENQTKHLIVKLFNDAATVTQDIAFFIDSTYGVAETIIMGGECVLAIESGCIPGAISGALEVEMMYNLDGANAIEQTFSVVSFGFTALADLADDGKFGEFTRTSLVTVIVGALTFDPIVDAGIDLYGAGYSNGFLNGIETIMNGGGIRRKR